MDPNFSPVIKLHIHIITWLREEYHSLYEPHELFWSMDY